MERDLRPAQPGTTIRLLPIQSIPTACLVIRGLGEAGYYPQEDVAAFQNQADMAVTRFVPDASICCGPLAVKTFWNWAAEFGSVCSFAWGRGVC